MNSTLPRNIRLITGLIIFTFVICHLLNLSLGLISVATMDRFLPVFMAPWYNPVGTAALFGSLLLHMIFSLHALYVRRTLHMTRFDAVQLLMALAIPPLLVLHVLGTRVANIKFGFEPTYAWMMVVYWKLMPLAGVRQLLVLVVAWIHGCMGLYYWLRLHTWWSRWEGFIYPLAFVIPVLAMLGFVEGGKDALHLAQQSPGWLDSVVAKVPEQSAFSEVLAMQYPFFAAYVAVLLAVLGLRAWRISRASRVDAFDIQYVDGPRVTGGPGLSILEVSKRQEISHASRCGGRGRCTTCRIRVVAGQENLSPPTQLESAALRRVGADEDVRLACQALPQGPVTIERIVPPDAPLHTPQDASESVTRDGIIAHFHYGQSRTKDIQQLADALEQSDVRIVQVTSNSIAAVFGSDQTLSEAMEQAMQFIDSFLHVAAATEVNVIVHAGRMKLSALNVEGTQRLTAEGEPIDTITRLQALLKDTVSTLLISQAAAAVHRGELQTDGATTLDAPIATGRWLVDTSTLLS